MKKKGFSIRLLALLLPACSVDTPVVEDNNALTDDRLGKGMGSWCESSCAKVDECGETEPDCTDDCRELFSTFVGKSDVCTESGLRLMDCLERASCAELSDDTCEVLEELSRCDASVDEVTCLAPRTGNGAAMPPPPCQLIYDECSNGSVYELSCASSGPGECECRVDGYTTGRFLRRGTPCPSAAEVRQICGWPIRDVDQPPDPPPVSCTFGDSSGAAGGGSVGDCEITFQGCSDGTNYGIICDGATASMCTCREDGVQVGPLVAPETVCPYVFDLDSGAATLNYACGFRIMSAIPEL